MLDVWPNVYHEIYSYVIGRTLIVIEFITAPTTLVDVLTLVLWNKIGRPIQQKWFFDFLFISGGILGYVSLLS